MGFVEIVTAIGFATGIIGSLLFSLKYKLDFAGRLMIVVLVGVASAAISGCIAGVVDKLT